MFGFVDKSRGLLFSSGDLREMLERHVQSLEVEVEGLNGERLLNTSPQDLVNYLVEKFTLTKLALRRDEWTVDQQEARIDVSREPNRFFSVDRSGPFYIPGQRIEVHVPFDGDPELFFMRASQYTSNPPRAQIHGNTLVLVFEQPHDQQRDIRHNGSLKAATLNTVTAAQEIGGSVEVLVAGYNAQGAAEAAAKVPGVTKVLLADAPHLADGLAENVGATVTKIAKGFSHILAPATAYGRNILPRIAATLDVAQISDVTAVKSADTFERPIYAGNAIATVQSEDFIKIVTVRTTGFDAAPGVGGRATVEKIEAAADTGASRFVSRDVKKLDRPELTSAKVVVSGGRGLGSGENYAKILEPLADKLNAALGASRAAVDAGFVPNDYQVGQTGKIVAPQLYVAVGISGAIQHLAGMKDSQVIVAINKDEDAPIFSVADYGLVGDLFALTPELVSAL